MANTAAVGLGTIHTLHLRVLIKQCLDEVYVPLDPWLTIIAGIALQVAASPLPPAVSSRASPDHEVEDRAQVYPTWLLAPPKEATLPIAKVSCPCIVVHTEDGVPESSHFVPADPYPPSTAITALAEDQYSTAGQCNNPQSEGACADNRHSGRVVLCGSPDDLRKLTPLMTLAVFVACHMRLETCLFQDLLISHMISDSAMLTQNTNAFYNQNTKWGLRRFPLTMLAAPADSCSSLWKWIWKKEHQQQQHQPCSNHPARSVSVVETTDPTLVKSVPWRMWPSEHPLRHPFEPHLASKGQSALGNMTITSTNLFDRTIQHIENTILSASPYIVFPPPSILLHLRDHESGRTEIAAVSSTDNLHQYNPMTPTTPTRNFFQNNPELGGQLNSLTPKSRIHQDLHSNSVAAGLVTVCPPSPSSPSKFTTLRNRIPADSKAGLSYLMKNNNSIGGVMRHQSISFAFSYFLDAHTTMPCQPPRLRTIRYYDKVSVGFQDCSIGKYVEMLCHDAIMPCSDPSCSHTMGEHLMAYHHDEGCVLVRTHTSTKKNVDHQDLQIYCWTSCSECHLSSEKTPLSLGGWHYSFGKFLELVLYHPAFLPNGICEHVSLNRSLVRRHFQRDVDTITFEFSHMDLFEMRLPRINVHQDAVSVQRKNIARRISYFESGEQDFEPRGDQIDSLRKDIKEFYQSLFEYLASALEISKQMDLDHYTTSLRATTDPSTTTGSPYSRVEGRLSEILRDMTSMFADEEYHFLESSISSTDLNLLRRMLSERMRERIVSIETLHKDYSSLSSCECDWKLPEYFDNSKPFVEYLGAITAFDSAAGQTFPDFQHTPTPDLDVDSWKSLGGECKYKIKRVSNSLASDAKGKHIHYRVSDSRVVFSCIVYFAKEFHALRKMCGIVPQFIQSLERSVHWNATGGKSTAAFYKTTDDQFILKELSSKWLVDEKETLFKFTPQYFEYLASSDKKPTLLTKILGFYTIKKKNSVTGQSSVLDVLVMENLFANVTISRRFDLKGVPDRHVVPRRIKRQDTKVDSDQVMWDGDWNAGQYKSLLRLFAHSKRILIESVHNDTDFLCKAKVMDYSLLVGVKDDKELVVGIVGM
ncbi:hypothetical protein BSLG_009523 [Batrachochytrium salamandrivorans]|nr:hypothetical protein BSLG_009523 [Batrachochytrium salamandrivorans]